MATGRIGTTPVLRTRWSKEPAGGTTSLSGLDDYSVSLVYEVGYEAVYQNGALLSRGNDYTATDGTTITLTNATVAGDIIEVFANNVVPLTDTYSQSVADGKFVNNTIVDAKGDLIVGSAADTFTRLAVGSANQVLTVDSATTSGLRWVTPSSGGMTLIQETVASANSGIDFTSIAGTYKQLMLVWSGLTQSGTGGGFGIRVNADSGTNYAYSLGGTKGSAVYQSSSNAVGDFADAQNGVPLFGYGFTSTDYHRASKGYIVIDNYASTSRFKPWWGIFTAYDATGTPSQINAFGTGVYKSTNAITQLNIVRTGAHSDTITNQTSTSIRLYGIA